jgi:EXLDI family protein
MPNKTIYVSEKDEKVFEQAQKLGNDALSAVIVRAIKEFVARNQDRRDGLTEITVQVGLESSGREQKFVGREIGKWQGTDDSKEWWMEAVLYKTQKDNLAVWLTTVAKAELLIHGAKNWLDWADNPRRSELLVGKTVAELKDKLPAALSSTLEDLTARDEAEVEYLDI